MSIFSKKAVEDVVVEKHEFIVFYEIRYTDDEEGKNVKELDYEFAFDNYNGALAFADQLIDSDEATLSGPMEEVISRQHERHFSFSPHDNWEVVSKDVWIQRVLVKENM
jgi:hypothetical protein